MIDNNTYSYFVVSRDIPSNGGSVSSLWLGIVSAYWMCNPYDSITVVIYLNSSVEHYITKSDYLNAGSIPKRHLINPSFKLIIM